jgi:transposase
MSIQHPVAVGVDPHADTLTAAAVDSAGHRLWDITVANTQAGIGGLIRRLDGQRVTWAIEGTGTFGRELCDQLLRRGDTVREVPTRLTGSLRRRSGFSKTDRADATTIARAALTEPLARVSHHPTLEALRVLIRQRETLVNAQTRAFNRLHTHLRELDPATARTLGRIRTRQVLQQLAQTPITDHPDPHRHALQLAIHLDAEEALQRLGYIRRLDSEIRRILPDPGHQLMTIPGIGVIGAATILAHTGDINRFPTEGHYARHAGTAPLDASSGRQQRHRFNRWGNRTLNKTIHIAIVTQLAQHQDAYHYLTRRLTEGKTKPEAIRAAKRHLTRRIYRILKQHPLTQEDPLGEERSLSIPSGSVRGSGCAWASRGRRRWCGRRTRRSRGGAW